MATAQEIATLKDFAEVPLTDQPMEDLALNALIDEEGDVPAAAARLWRRRASYLSTLADVTESGSSRKMSDLYKNALEISKTYSGLAGGGGSPTAGRPVSRRIVRESPL